MAMELRGSLNVSAFQKKPEQPKYYGRAMINGVEYELKGWEKDGSKGKWISLLFEHPDQKAERLAEEFAPTPKTVRQPLNPVKKSYVNDEDPF